MRPKRGGGGTCPPLYSLFLPERSIFAEGIITDKNATNVKEYIIILITLFLPLAAFAQRDIKTFEGKTTSALTDMIGSPLVLLEGDDTTEDADILTYQDTRLAIYKNTRGLDFFETTSNKYCIFSNLISGGIKVGDSFARLQSIDFAQTAYGRSKSSNRLKTFDSFSYEVFGYPANYVVYESEYCSVYFCVENYTIAAWSYLTKEDAPYWPYNGDIKIW
jgi:hypothetical protein